MAVILLALAGPARADRRFFLYTYSPFLDPPGEMEVETWLTTRTGKQDPAIGTQWEPRVEFEYAMHGRLGTAAYLNFRKEPGSPLELHSPSLEVIYALARPGTIPGDPALYLEASESGDELELETKLLLAHRHERWLSGMNLIGEFEFRHDDEELLPTGQVLKNGFAGEVTGGIAYEWSKLVAFGIESRYRSEHPNFGAQSAGLLSVGPSLNLRLGEAQLAIGVLPQIWGTPSTSGHRNLDAFERLQIRAIVGIGL
jgi:hypothetical protein